MSKLYVGSICGTSLDGIDVALVRFKLGGRVDVLEYQSAPMPEKLATAMRSIVFDGASCDAMTYGQLDQQFGHAIAQAINTLLVSAGVSPQKIQAVGSHGVNLLHAPDAAVPITLQIGDPNQIAIHTGITTVADFRRRDVGLGGQGAPLAPAFHAAYFSDKSETRVVLNLGGIANITLLAPGRNVIGFDTGPANGLLDAWYVDHHKLASQSFDLSGHWANQGEVNEALLEGLLQDDYFAKAPPKSTGKEHFNLDWLVKHINALPEPPNPVDVQATLAELTVRTISDSVLALLADPADLQQVLACGGGAHNNDLMRRLQSLLPHATISTTASCGVPPDQVEAVAFAWLAKRTLEHKPGNLPSVTGASRESVLGGVYYP